MSARRQLALALDVWRAKRSGMPGIRARQRARFVALVTNARRRSRFYARRYRDVPPGCADPRQYPPVTKRDLMAAFDDWVTDPAVTRAGVDAFVADPARIGEKYLGKYLVFSTSGTSGVPTILLQDDASMQVYNALGYSRALSVAFTVREVWGYIRGGLRTAGVFATGGHFVGATMMAARQRARPWRKKIQRIFSALDPLPVLVAELNEFQPAMLAAYASVLDVLADEQEAGRLHIHPVQVSSAGETLSEEIRLHAQAAFKVRVLDTYNASEVTAICFGCREGWQHINADWYLVEPVDSEYRPVPPGTISDTVLVTNLANRLQPIIRYDLGDRVIMRPDPCPCGNPLPAIKVEGRTNDTLALQAPDGKVVRVVPLAVGTVVEETPGVHQFQILQTGASTLKVRLAPADGIQLEQLWPAVAERLQRYLAEQGLADVHLELASEPPQRHPVSGKFRQVQLAS